jgi:arylsulfatase A-like enzyme
MRLVRRISAALVFSAALAPVVPVVVGAGCGPAEPSAVEPGSEPPSPGPGPRGPNVLLVVIDTLRADALSCYGNPRPLSPHLDALAADAALFEEAVSQAPTTAPSHATLFTGLQPWAHRVSNFLERGRVIGGMSPAFETLGERFAAAGYHTVAITDAGPLSGPWDLMQGFQLVAARYEGVQAKVAQALRALNKRDPGRPMFLFLHTYSVHQPFVPPVEWEQRFAGGYEGVLKGAVERARQAESVRTGPEPDWNALMREQKSFTDEDRAQLRRLYEACVAYTDDVLAHVWRRLEERGELDQWVIAVTSDHGEEFGEHGSWGHSQVYRETVHVPLVLRVPGPGGTGGVLGRGRRIAQRVGLIDLYPTLLEAAGLPPGAHATGRSLVPLLLGETLPDRTYFAETTEHTYEWGKQRNAPWWRSARLGADALMSTVRYGEDKLELFDHALDPREAAAVWRGSLPAGTPPAGAPAGDAAAGDPAAGQRAMALHAAIERHLAEQEQLRAAVLAGGPAAPEPVQLDAEALKTMKALGYTGEDE